MSFEEHISNGPQWVQLWIMWMMIVHMAALFFIVRWQNGRVSLGYMESYAIIAALIASFVFMSWLFEQYGYVRLLGLGHIPFWTPLAYYLWTRLANHPQKSIFGIYLRIVLVTIVISLTFDYIDVVRYLIGERGVM